MTKRHICRCAEKERDRAVSKHFLEYCFVRKKYDRIFVVSVPKKIVISNQTHCELLLF